MAENRGHDQETMSINKFKNFDVLSEDLAISDHRYARSNMSKGAQAVFSNPTSAVSRKIAREWRILQEGLPDLIYVRVYEQRIDLLRAVIIGTSGTPYHDGLFFFDIVLPSDYPNHPPKVHYHAHGYRLNPNLYASGFVCLSVVNTWVGIGKEKWVPSSSTLLQVLISIQGLVLNGKPFFNEPGFEVGLRQLGKTDKSSNHWIRNYMNYNHDVFILSCKTMLQKLKSPPKGFESFVLEHFRQRQDFILAAIKAYRDGTAVVGWYGEVSPLTRPLQLKCDKRCLSKIHSNLSKAFKDYGLSLSKTSDQEDPKLLNASKSQATEEKPKKGLVGKIIDAFKRMFR